MNKPSTEIITLAYMDEIHKAFNDHDIEAIVGFFADDGEFLLARGKHPWGTRLKGKTEIRDFLTRRFAELGDMQWKPITRFTCDNRAVSEWVVTGTLKNGSRLELYGCDLYEFRGRKIVKKDTYWKSTENAV